jgi:hypothetical protein
VAHPGHTMLTLCHHLKPLLALAGLLALSLASKLPCPM